MDGYFGFKTKYLFRDARQRSRDKYIGFRAYNFFRDAKHGSRDGYWIQNIVFLQGCTTGIREGYIGFRT